MIRPSEKVTRAMLNLHTNVSWQEIVSWIRESLLTQSLLNNKTTGETTIRNQGRNLELDELLNHIKKAPEYQKGG